MSNFCVCLSLDWTVKWMYTDADRAQKHGMDEFISANPCNFDHASLFELVQRLTLDHRLNDSYSCLVRKRALSLPVPVELSSPVLCLFVRKKSDDKRLKPCLLSTHHS